MADPPEKIFQPECFCPRRSVRYPDHPELRGRRRNHGNLPGLTKEHRDSFIHAVRLNDAIGSVIDFCWGLGIVSLYFTGIIIIGVDKVSIGTFIAFGTYISMFWHPIMNLSNFYNQMITNIAGAERVFEIMDTPSAITDQDGVRELPQIQGDVVFDKVTFSYDGTAKILNQVSFHINPGETLRWSAPQEPAKPLLSI